MAAVDRARLLRCVTGAPKLSSAGSVLYWMSRDQRVRDNWALIHARDLAAQAGAALAVVFCMTPGYPGATLRAYDFMLKGLEEVEKGLDQLGVPFFLLQGDAAHVLPKFAERVGCQALVTDFSPMPIKKTWLNSLLGIQYPPSGPSQVAQTQLRSSALPASVESVIEVDAHNTVPAWVASNRGGGSRAIREKIYPHMPTYLSEFPVLTELNCGGGGKLRPWDRSLLPAPVDWSAIRAGLKVDTTVPPVSWIQPGEAAAHAMAAKFAGSVSAMALYETKRIDPTAQAQSDLSPYFHFGHISAQRVGLMAKRTVEQADNGERARKGMELFTEQGLVRPSICDNWCYYTGLDAPDRWPQWALQTLAKHERDEREHQYTEEQLEFGRTHDELWNAAQHEMVVRGKMHGFLRMYWAKRILEWTPDAATAFDITLRLNDKYELDGRDPNGIVSIAWAIYGVHDAPFKPERPVIGGIRPMTYSGCKSKFNVPHLIGMIRNFCVEPNTAACCPGLLEKCDLSAIAAQQLPSRAPPPSGTPFVRSVDNPHHREIVERMQQRPKQAATRDSDQPPAAADVERQPPKAGRKGGKKNRLQ